jgi:hypothetical protein
MHHHFRTAMRAGVASLLVHGLCPAAAQGSDPTRPPGVAVAGSTPSVTEMQAPAAQIVVTGKPRPFVIVDGQMVHVGQTFRGLRLVAIGAQGPVWQREGARRIVDAPPGIDKSYSGPDARRPKSKQATKKSPSGEMQ